MSPSEHTFNSILPQKQLNLYLLGQKYASEWLFLNNCLYLFRQISFFQVEEVLIPKIQSSPAKSLLELYAGVEGEEMKRYM